MSLQLHLCNRQLRKGGHGNPVLRCLLFHTLHMTIVRKSEEEKLTWMFLLTMRQVTSLVTLCHIGSMTVKARQISVVVWKSNDSLCWLICRTSPEHTTFELDSSFA